MKLSAANGPCRLPWLLQIRNTFVLFCFINSKEREIGGYLGHREIGGYLGQAKIVVIMVGKFSSWCSLTLDVLLVPFRVAHHCQCWRLASKDRTWSDFKVLTPWQWSILPAGRWVFYILICSLECTIWLRHQLWWTHAWHLLLYLHYRKLACSWLPSKPYPEWLRWMGEAW